MARNFKDKNVPKNSGVDRWTNNGYGITIKALTKEQQAAVDQVNAEMAAKEAARKAAKKKK